MKKIIALLFIFSIFGVSSVFSAQITRNDACKYRDGIYEADWPVTYPGYNTKIKNFYKKWSTLYYAVNAYKYTSSTREWWESYLWSFNCKTRKPTKLSLTPIFYFPYTDNSNEYPKDKSWPYAEIDFADDAMMIIRVYNAYNSCAYPSASKGGECAGWRTLEYYKYYVYSITSHGLIWVSMDDATAIQSVKLSEDNKQRDIANEYNRHACMDISSTTCKFTGLTNPSFGEIYVTDIRWNDKNSLLVNYSYGNSLFDYFRTGTVIIPKSYFLNELKNKLFR